MSIQIHQPDLRIREIEKKVLNGERLSKEDGLHLYQTADLLAVGQLANYVNQQKNGDRAYFIQNMSLYFTNVCEAHCAFCHFRRDEGQEGAYTYTPEEILDYIRQHYHPELREFHITGGHNDHVTFDYYVDQIRSLRTQYPQVTIKAFTAAEIEFFSRLSGLNYRQVLERLKEAGLDTLPGGGAEILTERYRTKMHVDKATSQEWLDVHRTAHELGMKTHATMLYGAIETLEERLEHMIQLRELQDRTDGFLVFIPNAVQPANANAGIRRRVSAVENLKTIAVSRLMLDNFPHVKAYFINLGTEVTQVALSFGASDVHGTIVQERISHAAGALSPAGMTKDDLVYLIQGAGRTAVERDTFYNPVRIY